MASDSEPESGPADEQQVSPPKAAPSDRPKKKKARRPRLPIPQTEDEVDSPTKQTLGMLGILGIMTIVMWAFARGACNYHPPKETRVPRQVTLADLAHDPKNAAIELQQRWLTHDFDGALELAGPDVAREIQQDKAACDAACLGARKSLEQTVLTSAVIVEVNPMGATARVSSVGLPGGATKTFLLHMEHADAIWKAIERMPDTGAPLVPAEPTPSVAVSGAAAAPSGSAPAPVLRAVPHTPAPAASH